MFARAFPENGGRIDFASMARAGELRAHACVPGPWKIAMPFRDRCCCRGNLVPPFHRADRRCADRP
jgi:hypothetical protein